MSRKTEGPWFRAARNAWYVCLNGEQKPLGKHPDGLTPPKKRGGKWSAPEPILKKYHELMSAPEIVAPAPGPGSPAVVGVLDAFLEWVKTHKAGGTYESYVRRVQSFVDSLRKKKLLGMGVAELKPLHVQEWVDSHEGWNPGMKRGRMAVVQRAFNWAEKLGHVDRSPIRHMEKPPQGKRKQVVPRAVYDWMRARVNPAFRDLLVVSWETGCRPQESMAVEARHLDAVNGRWVFPEEESKGGKFRRVVYLTDEALAVCKRLAAEHPTGPIFRNTDGGSWTPFAANCTFLRFKAALGRERMKELGLTGSKHADPIKRRSENGKLQRRHGTKYCLYDLRHTFATRLLEKGVDSLTVSTLLGHRDGAMLAKVYSHISNSGEHLRDSLRKIE